MSRWDSLHLGIERDIAALTPDPISAANLSQVRLPPRSVCDLSHPKYKKLVELKATTMRSSS
jgi:hypothetical protein